MRKQNQYPTDTGGQPGGGGGPAAPPPVSSGNGNSGISIDPMSQNPGQPVGWAQQQALLQQFIQAMLDPATAMKDPAVQQLMTGAGNAASMAAADRGIGGPMSIQGIQQGVTQALNSTIDQRRQMGLQAQGLYQQGQLGAAGLQMQADQNAYQRWLQQQQMAQAQAAGTGQGIGSVAGGILGGVAGGLATVATGGAAAPLIPGLISGGASIGGGLGANIGAGSAGYGSGYYPQAYNPGFGSGFNNSLRGVSFGPAKAWNMGSM